MNQVILNQKVRKANKISKARVEAEVRGKKVEIAMEVKTVVKMTKEVRVIMILPLKIK